MKKLLAAVLFLLALSALLFVGVATAQDDEPAPQAPVADAAEETPNPFEALFNLFQSKKVHMQVWVRRTDAGLFGEIGQIHSDTGGVFEVTHFIDKRTCLRSCSRVTELNTNGIASGESGLIDPKYFWCACLETTPTVRVQF